MAAHQAGADPCGMKIKNYTTALPVAAGLAALLLTACGSSTSSSASSHPAAGTTTSPAPDRVAGAVAVTQQDDSNWAGYVLASSSSAKTSFSAVSGSWTQPAADCAAGSASYSAFWIGLGGYTGDHLEQTGTSADCSATGQAVYSAWYELVPAAQVAVTMTVQPGDRLSAHVAVGGDTVTVSISDSTRHTSFSKQLQMSDPTVSSAEWIAEAPSRCLSSASQDCHILSLADFGSVTFTGASASAGGRTGSITSGLGAVSALTLAANPGFGRLYATAAQADATPGALSGNGTSFTVNWEHPQIQTPTQPVIVSGPIYN
jgi:Peptidase A4 family